jgi:hypothetical protein
MKSVQAYDQLGSTAGLNGLAFTLVLTRLGEIFIGIVCVRGGLAGTDLGGAKRRLGSLLATLAPGIVAHIGGLTENH